MNLYETGQALVALLNEIDANGYDARPYDDGTIRLALRDGPNSHHYVELNNPHGYWDITSSSGGGPGQTTDVLVPKAAFDMLLELAQYSREGGQTTPAGRRAVEALEKAGLLPGPGCSPAAAEETVPNNQETT